MEFTPGKQYSLLSVRKSCSGSLARRSNRPASGGWGRARSETGTALVGSRVLPEWAVGPGWSLVRIQPVPPKYGGTPPSNPHIAV